MDDQFSAKNTICQQCGRGFNCGVASDQESCWCFDFPLIIQLSGAVADGAEGCLCPRCLHQRVQHFDDQHDA